MSVNKNTNGSVMIAALLLILITGSLVGLFLKTVTLEVRNAYRSKMAFKAVNVAEAGLEYAIYAINAEDYADWETMDDGYYRTRFNAIDKLYVNWQLAERHRARVYFEPDDIAPIAIAEGIVRSRAGVEVRRQIYIELGPRTPFANGVVARDTITFNGNGIYVDSYISRPTRFRDWEMGQHPFYDDWVADPDNLSYKYAYGQPLDWASQGSSMEANIEAHTNESGGNYVDDVKDNILDAGTVASNSFEDGILKFNNSDIWGRAATGGGSMTIKGKTTIRGEDSPDGVLVDPNRIATDFYMSIPPVEEPDLDSLDSPPSARSIDNTSMTVWGGDGSYEYEQSTFSIANDNEIHIIRGNVVMNITGDVDIKGQLIPAKKGHRIPTWDSSAGEWAPYENWEVVSEDASLELHVGGDFFVGGTDGSITNGGDYIDTFLKDVEGEFGSDAVVLANSIPGSPEDVILYGYGADDPATSDDESPEWVLQGSGSFYGGVYAPNADVKLGGGGTAGEMFGAVVAYSIEFGGNYQFHYDEALAEYENKELRKVTRWLELTDAEERQKMAPMLN